MEYWCPINLFCIARAVGHLLKIDRMTLEKENCMFERVLVDVDLANTLPEKVLVKRKQMNFFVDIFYEKLHHTVPSSSYVGHPIQVYRKEIGARRSENLNFKDRNKEGEVFSATQNYKAANQGMYKVGEEHAGSEGLETEMEAQCGKTIVEVTKAVCNNYNYENLSIAIGEGEEDCSYDRCMLY